MRRVALHTAREGSVLLMAEDNYGYAKIILTPEEANKLAYRLMSHAAGGGESENVIMNGDKK